MHILQYIQYVDLIVRWRGVLQQNYHCPFFKLILSFCLIGDILSVLVDTYCLWRAFLNQYV